MIRREIVYATAALDDLLAIYDQIADAAGPRTAMGYVGRLQAYCDGLEWASERGHRRDDIAAGLRIVGFERSATIAFRVETDRVLVLRVFRAGRDWETETDFV